MGDVDALSGFKFGGGSFLKELPAKIRILTLDPMVSTDNYGNTRYSFVVWNFTENKAQILSKGPGVAQEIQKIHEDEDWGSDIRQVDIKLTSTGSGKETRYGLTPLPNSPQLTAEQVKEASEVDMSKAIKGGVRLSEFAKGKKPTNPTQELTREDLENEDQGVTDDELEQPINLDDIPF